MYKPEDWQILQERYFLNKRFPSAYPLENSFINIPSPTPIVEEEITISEYPDKK